MLSLLRPKRYLVDLFQNFTDIHNHILPGIDDGAQDVKESIKLIKQLNDLGIDHFICTPHTMGDYYPNTPETINSAAKLLQDELQHSSINSSIHASSEYMLDEEFSDHLQSRDLLPLADKYLLVEISYLQPPINLEELLFELTHAGYIPVLAHPERYSYYHKKPDYYKELERLGCVFQLNALSLSNYYGKSVKKMTYQLLEEGLYTYIGTDTHSKRHVKQLREINFKRKHFNAVEHLVHNTKESFGLG